MRAGHTAEGIKTFGLLTRTSERPKNGGWTDVVHI